MTPKALYRRFRTWQKEPLHYSIKKKGCHHCANCGHEYEGNYCPVCRQEAGDGRITWEWVRKSLLEVWGMDSRSLPRTLLHLLLRPGYLIGDYISGHRQVCYKPLNMLFIVALIYAIVKQLLGVSETEIEKIEGMELLYTVSCWLQAHPGWGMMTLTFFFTIPTWFFFRFSPRHTRHTFPEGVFIQLFMCTLMFICVLLDKVCSIFFLLIPFYYYLTYRQLFGYSLWGTLWRLGTSFLVWLLAILFATVLITMLTSKKALFDGNDGTQAVIVVVLIFLIPQAVLLAIGYWIGRRTEKKRNMEK